MSENFPELYAKSLEAPSVRPGSLIFAEFVSIEADYAIVKAGLKSLGRIPLNQFDKKEELQVGAEVQVAVEGLDDGFGGIHLSREKAKRAIAWDNLQKAFENKSVVEGTVTGKVKGGFTVDMGALQGFLPGSLVDLRPIGDIEFLEGNQFEFRVIKLDPRRNNIVLSRRAALEAKGQAIRDALLDQLEEGQIVEGVVKNIAPYGAFIDLGGIDGLLHKTDMAWQKVEHPNEVLDQKVLDQKEKISVVILKIDRSRARPYISLGLKQLAGDPWINLPKHYPIGSKWPGTVTKITDYGCFVELEPGVEGLVHTSQMDWTNRNANPNKIVRIDPDFKIEVMILDIDVERRRISLGIKQCKDNPWKLFADQYNKGDRIQGKIEAVTNVGLFIRLGDIDGLVHHSEIADNLSGEEAIRRYKKGDTIEALILSIDPDRERVALSIRQMEDDSPSVNTSEEKNVFTEGKEDQTNE